MKRKQLLLCISLLIVMLIIPLSGCREDAPADPQTDGNGAGNVTENPAEDVADTENAAGNETEQAAFSFSEGFDENGFWRDIRALDYVEMFNFRAMSIPSSVHTISDVEIQAQIYELLAHFPPTQIMDRPVAHGDKVNIDFVGTIDGEEFGGGSTFGMGFDVIIGVTAFIDNFLYQLIGSMPGDTVYVEVTFPEDYHAVDLQGKEALFVTVINYIEGEAVELTDEFVLENLSDINGWTTVEEVRDTIRLELRELAIHEYLHEYFTTRVVVRSVPDRVINYQQRIMVGVYQQNADMFGMSLDEFLNLFLNVPNVATLIELFHDSILKEATFSLVAQAVAEYANLSVTREDIEDYFYKLTFSRVYSHYEEAHGLPFLKHVVLTQMVLDYITENAILQ